MYKVSYYMTAGTLTTKLFKTLSEAIRFSVYGVTYGSVHQITKVDKSESL